MPIDWTIYAPRQESTIDCYDARYRRPIFAYMLLFIMIRMPAQLDTEYWLPVSLKIPARPMLIQLTTQNDGVSPD